MRTLVIVRSLKLGGMERVAVNLADAFAEQGHESHLMTCRQKYKDLAPSRSEVKVHNFDQMRVLMGSVIGIPVFLISRLLLGVLLPHSHFIWTGWLIGFLLKRRVKKLEREYGQFDRIIFRGLGTYKYFWSFRDERCVYVLENVIHYDRPLWQKIWEWKLVFHDRHLVCVSSGVLDSAREAFDKGNIKPRSIRVITNPCPVEDIRRLASEDDPDIPGEPYLVNVARLVPQKGHRLLIDAYEKANVDHNLVIVGDGELRGELERYVQTRGLSERVLFTGKKRNPYPWMKHADAFLLASEYEGLGIVLTEALACGTPIMSVRSRGGVTDVFQGELAEYLTPRTTEAFAEGIQKLCESLPISVKEEWLAPYRSESVVEAFLK